MFLTIKEVADLLRVDLSTAYRHVSNGQIPGLKVGHGWRVNEDDLEKYMNTQGRYGREIPHPK